MPLSGWYSHLPSHLRIRSGIVPHLKAKTEDVEIIESDVLFPRFTNLVPSPFCLSGTQILAGHRIRQLNYWFHIWLSHLSRPHPSVRPTLFGYLPQLSYRISYLVRGSLYWLVPTPGELGIMADIGKSGIRRLVSLNNWEKCLTLSGLRVHFVWLFWVLWAFLCMQPSVHSPCYIGSTFSKVGQGWISVVLIYSPIASSLAVAETKANGSPILCSKFSKIPDASGERQSTYTDLIVIRCSREIEIIQFMYRIFYRYVLVALESKWSGIDIDSYPEDAIPTLRCSTSGRTFIRIMWRALRCSESSEDGLFQFSHTLSFSQSYSFH